MKLDALICVTELRRAHTCNQLPVRRTVQCSKLSVYKHRNSLKIRFFFACFTSIKWQILQLPKGQIPSHVIMFEIAGATAAAVVISCLVCACLHILLNHLMLFSVENIFLA